MTTGGSSKSVAESMVQLGVNVVKLGAQISQIYESLFGPYQHQKSEYWLYLCPLGAHTLDLGYVGTHSS